MSAGRPKRASRNGWRGMCRSGPEISSTNVSQLRACGANVCFHRCAVRAERAHRLRERAVEDTGGAVVERMRERELRVRELEPVTREIERSERRRARGERMDRRAHVVQVSGQRQLLGPRTAADVLGRLEDEDLAPRDREERGRGQPVRTRAHDDGVVLRLVHAGSLARRPRANFARMDAPIAKMTRTD